MTKTNKAQKHNTEN